MEEIKYNKEADAENMKLFEEYTQVRQGAKVFTCVLCGKKFSLDQSSSIKGHKLICFGCEFEHFGGTVPTKHWQQYDND